MGGIVGNAMSKSVIQRVMIKLFYCVGMPVRADSEWSAARAAASQDLEAEKAWRENEGEHDVEDYEGENDEDKEDDDDDEDEGE
eukprot:9319027-Pyramimonas_sp.AAC.1